MSVMIETKISRKDQELLGAKTISWPSFSSKFNILSGTEERSVDTEFQYLPPILLAPLCLSGASETLAPTLQRREED